MTKFLNHTALRIADPTRSLQFYQKHFGMSLLTQSAGTTSTKYVLGLTGPKSLYKDSPIGARAGLLQLVHNNADTIDSFTANSGNKDPYRGFGHICFSVADLEGTCSNLEKSGVTFHKRLVDGRQKNIAFALDPDGYWIEIISNDKQEPDASGNSTSRLNHSMIRVKDKDVSLEFYTKTLGMTLVDISDHEGAKFTLYFLSFDPEQVKRDGRANAESLVELTYNYGSESDDSVKYHSGESGPQGFLHFGVTTDNTSELVSGLKKAGFNVATESNGTYSVQDPDGYRVEIIASNEYKL